jgi:hypothetical protein
MSPVQSHHEGRRSARESVVVPSQIWSATIVPMPALIVNISPHGCMVRCNQVVPTGEHLTIDIPSVGALRGIVIWSLGERIGIEFAVPIGLDAYLNMLDGIQPAPDADQAG